MIFPTPITNKYQMYQLFEAGEFGNTGLDFPDGFSAYQWLREDIDNRLMMIRTKTPQGPCIANIPFGRLIQTIGDLRAEGFVESDLQFSAMMPDSQLYFQGYFHEERPFFYDPELRTSTQWVLEYNDTPGVPMRVGMQYPKQIWGGRVFKLLSKTMDTPSWNKFIELHEKYPGHVIEFTVYRVPCGSLNWNTCIWEVRQY